VVKSKREERSTQRKERRKEKRFKELKIPQFLNSSIIGFLFAFPYLVFCRGLLFYCAILVFASCWFLP